MDNQDCGRRPAAGQGGQWLDVVVAVTNYEAIGQRFSDDIAEALDREFVRCFQNLSGARETLRLGPGRIKIAGVLRSGMSLSRASTALEHLLGQLARIGGLLTLAIVEATAIGPDGRPRMKVVRIPASEGSAHLLHAQEVLKAVAAGQLAFSFQPVFNLGNRDDVLYEECLARVVLPEAGGIMMPLSFIPSIERAGLVNEFDRSVVSAVLDRLAADEARVLGCNISARSARVLPWWAALFERLAQRPELARRLVIEITETAPVAAGEGRIFARRLSSLGCRVAIDDFGTGHGVQNGMEIGVPDIVKLDASLLRDVERGVLGIGRLCGLAGLARDLAPVVVMEGVETLADLAIVQCTACEWAQGYLQGERTDAALQRAFC